MSQNEPGPEAPPRPEPCYGCGAPPVYLCRFCGRFYCRKHGSAYHGVCNKHLWIPYLGILVLTPLLIWLAVWWSHVRLH